MPSDDNFATFQVPPNILHFHHSLREMQLFYEGSGSGGGGPDSFLPSFTFSHPLLPRWMSWIRDDL